MLASNKFLCFITFAAGIIGASSFSPIHPAPKTKRAVSSIRRSTLPGERSRPYQSHQHQQRSHTNLFAEPENEESTTSGKVSAALPPAAISSLPPANEDNENGSDGSPPPSTIESSAGTTALFIDQQSKRILIEELGYTRNEVERLRPELAQPIISQRMYRPKTDSLPKEWLLAEDDTNAAMIKRLENESKYPLKFPLLGISLVLFGKGLSDALITIIKVNINFPGASLTEQFMGVPVLGIDAVCVLVGAGLAWWTWNTMKD